ncbi:MAG TPA: ethanolamine utilization microcompartment protein EutL [Candidatus Copromorpha excrementigallinarum]|uniref:Ethanolamine utilization microcompartment protein EutL n=1 Tax=Candidatus Allocopromorpha excrementigallinarum TaxID=2840742 RepID=A0A9D1I131_9FIRM|nr:ethanolamine utilization microcompartment protein EutL [Candidatus Copromorpha excrementigallinarum]
MKGDKIYPEILSAFLIPQMTEEMKAELGINENHTSAGIVTADIDDLIFIGMDEATKKANVKASYSKSFYAGGANSSSKLQGEGLGIITGESISEVKAGLDAILDFSESRVLYAVSCNDEDSISYLVYTIASIGSYFADDLKIEKGSSIAYLASPPVESIYASDEALKASGAELAALYAPPTVTNTGGAILTGSQSQCEAACRAFAEAVQEVADNPVYR